MGCGVEEAQQPGYNGYLVRQSDPKDIAEKVGKILNGNTELLGEHSKDFASRFTWEKTVKEYIKYYTK
jgi:glycosyltransferase involved in cell wall biosynthesis